MFSATLYSSNLEWCVVLWFQSVIYVWVIKWKSTTHGHLHRQAAGGACSPPPRSFGFCTQRCQHWRRFETHLNVCVCVSTWVTPEEWHQTERLLRRFSRLLRWSTSSVSEAGRLVWAKRPSSLISSSALFFSVSWLDVASLPLRGRQKVSLTRRFLCRADKGEFTRCLKAQNLLTATWSGGGLPHVTFFF